MAFPFSFHAPPNRMFPAVALLLGGIAAAGEAAERTEDIVAPLRLIAEVDGRRSDDVSSKLEVRFDGELAKIDPDAAIWRLEGDLSANARYLYFAPDYEVWRTTPDDLAKNPHRGPVRVKFYLSASDPIWRNRPHPNSRFDPISSLISDGSDPVGVGLLVFVWMVDGKPARIVPHRFRDIPRDRSLIETLRLTDDEARGRPCVLVRRHRTWDLMQDVFDSREAHQVLTAIHLHDDNAVRTAIAALGKIHPDETRHLLNLAVESGHSLATSLLLERSDAWTDRTRIPAVDFAVRGGRRETASLLVRHANRKFAGDARFPRAYDVAVERGLLEVAWEILSAEPDWRADKRRIAKLSAAAVRYGRNDVVEALAPLLEP